MRQPRHLVNGAHYHVTGRINHQERRLDDAATKKLFLDVLGRAKKKYAFRIENFTILGNHYHLIIKPGDTSNLSKIMQWIMGVFAMTYNRIHGLKGHLWQDRFFSHILATLTELVQTSAYIDENPVKAGLAIFPWEWDFGGLVHRRMNYKEIVDPLDPYLYLLLPTHQGLLISR